MRYIKKSLLKLAALLFLLSATHAYGGAYVMPVNTVPKGNQATTTMEIIEWTEEEGIPNPCYKWGKCLVGPDVQYKTHPPGMHGSCDIAGVCLTDAQKYPTTADVMRAYKKKFGIPKRVTFDIMTADSECVGLFYAPNTFLGKGNAEKFPNSTCNKMPPPRQACKIYIPSEIAYGELIASEVNNASRTINGYLECALPSSKIQLHAKSIDGEPKVYFDSSRQMHATLQINDQDAANGVRVTARKNNERAPFTLKSTLHTITLPKAGKYEGTAVVYLTYL